MSAVAQPIETSEWDEAIAITPEGIAALTRQPSLLDHDDRPVLTVLENLNPNRASIELTSNSQLPQSAATQNAKAKREEGKPRFGELVTLLDWNGARMFAAAVLDIKGDHVLLDTGIRKKGKPAPQWISIKRIEGSFQLC